MTRQPIFHYKLTIHSLIRPAGTFSQGEKEKPSPLPTRTGSSPRFG